MTILTLSTVESIPIDEFTEKSGDTYTIHSYQKYYKDNGKLLFLNESFTGSGCDKGYNYCVKDNLFQVDIKDRLNSADPLKYTNSGNVFYMRPIRIYYSNEYGQIQTISYLKGVKAVIVGNTALWKDEFGTGIDIEYSYMPWKWKPKIVIHNKTLIPEPILKGNVTINMDFVIKVPENMSVKINNSLWNPTLKTKINNSITFTKNQTEIFEISAPLLLSDTKDIFMDMEIYQKLNTKYVSVKVFLDDIPDDRFVIDPDIVYLNHTDIFSNGDVQKTHTVPANYTLDLNPPNIMELGYTCRRIPCPILNERRAWISWIYDMINDTQEVIDARMYLYLGRNATNLQDIQFRHMDYDNTNYPLLKDFYDDMGDGDLYNFSDDLDKFTGGVWLHLTENFTTEINDNIQNDIYNISIGSMINPESTGAIPHQTERYVSRDFSTNPAWRPKLNLTVQNISVGCIPTDGIILDYTICRDGYETFDLNITIKNTILFHNYILNLTKPFKWMIHNANDTVINNTNTTFIMN